MNNKPYKPVAPTLSELILSEPQIVYKNVRVENKGIRTPFIPAVVYAGRIGGVGCSEYAKIMGKCRQWAHTHLGFVASHGYIVKRGFRYYATDIGMKIRVDALAESKDFADRLSKEFTRRARLSLGRSK